MTTETKSTWELEREEERRKSQERTTRLRLLIAGIRLEGWSYKLDPDFEQADHQLGVLVNPAIGGELHFGTWWNDNTKLHISATYPKDSRGHEHIRYKETRVSINVSAAKTPEQIAKDIVRRILPDYTRQLAEINESIQKTEERLCAKSEMGRAIASAHPWLRLHDTINGTDYHGRKQNGSEVTLDEKYDSTMPRVGKVQCSEKRAEIELDGLTLAQTLEVLKLIATMKGGHKCDEQSN